MSKLSERMMDCGIGIREMSELMQLPQKNVKHNMITGVRDVDLDKLYSKELCCKTLLEASKLDVIMTEHDIDNTQLGLHMNITRQAVQTARTRGMNDDKAIERYAKALTEIIGKEVKPVEIKE